MGFSYSMLLLLTSVLMINVFLHVSGLSELFMLNLSFWLLGGEMVDLPLLVDWASVMMVGVVSAVAMSVFIYSVDYMKYENLNSFMKILLSFVISMFVLCLCPHAMGSLLGWDGLGLSSYGLVIFYNNDKSLNAGMLTILSNRVGDCTFLVVAAILVSGGGWDLFGALKCSSVWSVVFILLIISAMTKSAQFPFSVWLPAAMAAPTPVSSLVHSSTLVAAGVYLIYRVWGVVEVMHIISNFKVLFLVTSAVAGASACYEKDLKKIVAYSTLGQLGLLMFGLSLSLGGETLFHLSIHAFYKALLFMSVGALIYVNQGVQDMRLMSGSLVGGPVVSSLFLSSSLVSIGFPFMSGFYSKDLLVEGVIMGETSIVIIFMLYFSLMLTVASTLRVILILVKPLNYFYSMVEIKPEMSPLVMSMSVLYLLILSSGASYSWLINSMEVLTLPLFMKTSIIQVSVMGVVMSVLVSVIDKNSTLFIEGYSINMWGLSLIIRGNLISPVIKWGGEVCLMDQSWLDYLYKEVIYNISINMSILSNFFRLTSFNILILMSFMILMMI